MEAQQTTPDVDKSWVDYLMVGLSAAIFLNWIVAVVLELKERGFQTVPMWILLLSLCIVAKNMPFTAVLVGLGTCTASELICYFKEDPNVKLEKIPPLIISVFVLLLILDLLASTKLENVSSRREMEYRSFRKNQNEHLELVEKLKAKQLEAKEKKSASSEDQAISGKRLQLEMLKGVYTQILGLRFKREVPKVLENMFSSWFKIPCGIVYEQDLESKDLRLRNHWGVSEKRPDALAAISSLKDNKIVRRAADLREILTPEEAQKDMDLFTALQKFNAELFELTYAIPIVVQDRPIFVVFVGKPDANAPIPFELKQIQPIIQALSMSINKIGAKDSRPRLSTFAPGS